MLTLMTDDAQVGVLSQWMADLGAPDPAGWAGSEVREDIPQQARYLVLRSLWSNINAWGAERALRGHPAGARLLDAGADLGDLSALARAVAYEMCFGVLERVGEGHDPDAPDDAPGWVLMETEPGGELTGRQLSGLHEDLLTLDPSGGDGRDLWE